MHEGRRKESSLIHDSLGRQYRVKIFEKGPCWRLRVYRRFKRIGEAVCRAEPPLIRLDSIRIGDQRLGRESRAWGSFRLGLRRTTLGKYRRRGVGSALLQLISTRAVQRGFNGIEVSLDNNADMTGWYRRRGFSAESGKLKIRLQLSSHQSLNQLPSARPGQG